jgi:hypothetical protein
MHRSRPYHPDVPPGGAPPWFPGYGDDPTTPPAWLPQLPEQTPLNGSSSALEAARAAATSACRLYGFTVFNSKASAQFILVFDANALPADGAVTPLVYPVAATSPVSVYWGSTGRWFSRGVIICNSSTSTSKTIGAADCFFDAQFL